MRVFAQWVAWAGMTILLVNVFLQMTDVLCRWLFALPLSWVADIQEVTVPVAITACFPETLFQRGMINITFLGSAVGRKFRSALNALGAIALLVVMVCITREVFTYANEIAASNRGTWLLRIPLAPTWYLVDVVFVLSTLTQLCVLFQRDSGAAEKRVGDGL